MGPFPNHQSTSTSKASGPRWSFDDFESRNRQHIFNTCYRYRVLFVRTSDLVQRLQAARRDLRLPAELAKLDRFDLLVCDDFSYVRRDQSETSVLFELIAERYERRSMAITANQPFSGWDHVFAEPAMTLAAVDRLVHHSTIFEMNVESFRRRSAQTGLAPSVQSKKTNVKDERLNPSCLASTGQDN